MKLIIGVLLAYVIAHNGLCATKNQILECGQYKSYWSVGFNEGLDIEIKNKNKFIATFTSYGCIVVDGKISMSVRKVKGKLSSLDNGSVLFETKNKDFPHFFNIPTRLKRGNEIGIKQESDLYNLNFLMNQEKGILIGRKLEQ